MSEATLTALLYFFMPRKILFYIILLINVSYPNLLFSENQVEASRNFVKEWVNVEKTKSLEAEEGAIKIEILKNSNRVLKKQLEQLKEVLKTQKKLSTQTDEEREKWSERERTLSKRIAAVKEMILKLEPKVLQMQTRLPPQLREKLDADFKNLKLKQHEKELHLAERAQLLTRLLMAIQDFNQGIHLGYEILQNNKGESIEVKVLYIGLGCAYYCSKNSELAGFAKANAETWTWIPKPELAPTIQRAFQIYENEHEQAEFLALPTGDAS
jgi:hypothetical protein